MYILMMPSCLKLRIKTLANNHAIYTGMSIAAFIKSRKFDRFQFCQKIRKIMLGATPKMRDNSNTGRIGLLENNLSI